MGAYSGALSEAARFPRYTSVPGVSGGHVEPTEEADPFSPEPTGVQQTTADVWQPQDVSQQTEMIMRPVSHWADLESPVPSNIEGPDEDIAATTRWLANHSQMDYRPDLYVPYKHATQGLSIDYTDGRRPQGPSLEALQMGRNSYDITNAPSEVYGGDRYRVGTWVEIHGQYQFWTKQGQDGWLRAYAGLEPQLPVDKERVADSAPYTPNSSGTSTWAPGSAWQAPSSFALPSETASSDFVLSMEGQAPEDEFDDGGRL